MGNEFAEEFGMILKKHGIKRETSAVPRAGLGLSLSLIPALHPRMRFAHSGDVPGYSQPRLWRFLCLA